MTKTLSFTILAIATAHVAMAQTVFVPPAPPAAPAPFAAPLPAPMPLADVAVTLPPFPPEPPQAPQVAVPPAAPVPAPLVFEPFDYHLDIDPSLWDLKYSLGILKDSLTDQAFELKAQNKGTVGPVGPAPAPVFARAGENGSYDQARGLIERDQYERALPILDRVIQAKGDRVDAAMYWKAYSLSKLTRRPEALTVLADLQKEFPAGAWVRDARALEVEVRQASGQSVPTNSSDDDVKLLALRGLMQNDPDTAVPVVEKMLQGTASVKVKDRALFLLSQSRSGRARDVITGVATSASNPDLRLSAVRYLGMRQDPDSVKVLADIYSSTSDVEIKRAILRSLGAVQARDRLLAVAKSEKSAELRAVAVQQLGAARGSAELEELYRSETDKEVKQRILQSFVAANASDKLAAIARTEKDPDLQRMAIRNLGASNSPDAAESLLAIYRSDAPVETKKAVLDGLSMHQNCSGLVALAKAEKNKDLQTEIVRRLANQTSRCTEARDYMLELLK